MQFFKLISDSATARSDGEYWLLKSHRAWNNFQQQNMQGHIPRAEDIAQLPTYVYSDVQLLDVVQPRSFYHGCLVSDWLKSVLDKFDHAPGQFFFFEKNDLQWRGQTHHYWWMHPVAPTAEYPYFHPKHDLLMAPDGQAIYVSPALKSAIEEAGITGFAFQEADLSGLKKSLATNPAKPGTILVDFTPYSEAWRLNDPQAPTVEAGTTPENWIKDIMTRINDGQRAAVLGEQSETDVVAILSKIPRLALVADYVANQVAATGQSQFVGRPLLPKRSAWPRTDDGKPLFFVAQINLAEMPANPELPTEGMLAFFVDVYGSTNGWPVEPDRSQVLFFPTTAELVGADIPADLPVQGDFQAKPLRFRPVFNICDNRWPEVIGDETANLISRFWTEISEDTAVVTDGPKLLGWPRCLQGYVGQEAVLHHEFGGDYSVFETRVAEINAAAQKWKLLFQFSAGDAGIDDLLTDPELYFMIREEDLKAQLFERTALVVQNT